MGEFLTDSASRVDRVHKTELIKLAKLGEESLPNFKVNS